MRYRLPEALGGGEFEGERVPSRFAVALSIPGISMPVEVSDNAVTEVVSTAQPPVGTVVSTGDAPLNIFHRPMDNNFWYRPGEETPFLWPEVCAFAQPGTPVLLVPDPFAEPVELPWRDGPFEVKVREDAEGSACSVQLLNHFRELRNVLTPQRARAMADALRSAANAAEESP